MNNSGATSYIWNPPEITPEEEEKFRKAYEKRIRETAKECNLSEGWVKAMLKPL